MSKGSGNSYKSYHLSETITVNDNSVILQSSSVILIMIKVVYVFT